MPFQGNGWSPTGITRAIQGLATAARTAQVDTDLGEGFLKGLGSPEGPHALACELVGSLAADWLGLKCFDFSIINVADPQDVAMDGKSWAQPGPAFISRSEEMGFTWGGDAQTLSSVSNQDDFMGLVVVDTWLRNCDRYSPDGRRVNLKNVFLRQRIQPHRSLELIAMDFTHAFTCGGPLDRRLGHIEKIRDVAIYGRFPEFEPYLSAGRANSYSDRLRHFDGIIAESFISKVPTEWQVDGLARSNWTKFLVERARFTADTIQARLWPTTEVFNFAGDEQ